MEGRMVALPLMAVVVLVVGTVMVEAAIIPATGLTRHFYKKTNSCANVEAFVKHQVAMYWNKDKTITPKLLRLAYTDCMVTGCDASILLDGSNSEKTAPQNIRLGAYTIIDKIKAVIEKYCHGVVSCADILQLATRDAVHLAGGPSYIVLTGRRDGLSSKASNVDLPSPDISWQDGLKYFESRGLNVQHMVALLGAHSTGKTRCHYIKSRLYNLQGTGKPDPTLDPSLLKDLQKQCPQKLAKGQHEGLVYLDKDSGDKFAFSNSYFNNILSHKGVLRIDQQLYYGNDTLDLTQEFADPKSGMQDFKLSFALSMNEMASYKVLTGTKGEIRKHCRFTNSNNPHLKH